MRNSHKVLSIALLALSVSLFSCGGNKENIVTNPPPPPGGNFPIVLPPIAISNLSPTSIVLFHNSGTHLDFPFDQTVANANGNLEWHLILFGDPWIGEVRDEVSGLSFPSPVIQISEIIDSSTLIEGEGGTLPFGYVTPQEKNLIDFGGPGM